jgi:cell wall-associated NlpC family hydrolase
LLRTRLTLRGLVVAVLALALTATTATSAHAAPSKADIQKQIDKASNDLEDVVESYNKMRLDMKATETAEKSLAASIGPARAEMAAANTEVDALASETYKTGQVGGMSMLLGDSTGLMDRLSILEHMSRERERDITRATETTQQYETTAAGLHSTQQKQAAQVKELEARKAKIEGDLKKLYAMRTAANGSPTEKGVKYTGKVPAIAGSAGKAVSFAYAAIGVMYVYGADGPDGYDCSGLTMAAWRAAGKSLPHNAAAQWDVVTHIGRGDLKEGDLVFYRSLGHVGLYVGGGQIIDASTAGKPVRKRTMDIMTPYGYGRVK